MQSTRTNLNKRALRGLDATERRRRELQSEAVVSVACVTVLMALSLGALVGFGLGRALVSFAPVSFAVSAP